MEEGLEGRGIGSREINQDSVKESFGKDYSIVDEYIGLKFEMRSQSLLNN